MNLNFNEALSKLKKSKEFLKFKKENGDAYLCSAFFIIDFEGNQNSVQLNYQLGNEKIAAFLVGDEIKEKVEDLIEKKKLEKLRESIKVDIDEAVSLSKKQIKEQDLKGKISKMIAILTKEGKKEIWNVTCFLEALQILNVHIDAYSGKILKSEKKALSDFFNKAADYIG